MSKTIKGIISVIIGASLWGSTCLFVNYFEKVGLDTMHSVLFKLLFATVAMFLILIIYNPKLLKIKLKDLWVFLCDGIVSLLFFSYFYFKAIRLAGASTAAVLLYTAPVFVTVISVFVFKEKINKNKIISCILAVIGCAFVSGIIGSNGISVKALLFGLGAGLGYALYSIFTEIAIKKGYHSFTIIFYAFLFSSIGTLLITDYKTLFAIMSDKPTAVGVSLLMSILTAVLPYLFYTYGLTCIEPSRASIIATVEPVMASLLGYFVLEQALGIYKIIGIALVLLSLIILNLKLRK